MSTLFRRSDDPNLRVWADALLGRDDPTGGVQHFLVHVSRGPARIGPADAPVEPLFAAVQRAILSASDVDIRQPIDFVLISAQCSGGAAPHFRQFRIAD